MITLLQSLLIGVFLLFLLPRRKEIKFPSPININHGVHQFRVKRLSPLGVHLETNSNLDFSWQQGDPPLEGVSLDEIDELKIEAGKLVAFIPGRSISIQRLKEIASKISTLMELLQTRQNETCEDDNTPLPMESQTLSPN